MAKRSGIALLTTVGLVMILSLIILKSVDISEKYFDRAAKSLALVQLDKAFIDVLGVLQSSTKEIKDASTLSTIVGLPIALGTPEGDMNVVIDITSAGGVININNLLKNGTINDQMYSMLLSLLNENRVINSNFFMALLLDAIDDDKNERVYQSEAAAHDSRYLDGGINSKESFNFLLDYFVANGGDAKIYSIKWDEIVGFFGEGVDYNYIQEPLLDLIKKEYNLASLPRDMTYSSFDELRLSSGESDTLRALGVNFYAPRIFCDIRLFYLGQQMRLKFLYDIGAKKVGYIETVF